MKYTITLWKLSGPFDEVDSKASCYCETFWEATEFFNTLRHGIKGHYKAWLVENETGAVQESSVTYTSV